MCSFEMRLGFIFTIEVLCIQLAHELGLKRAQRVPAEKTSRLGLGTITRRTQEAAR